MVDVPRDIVCSVCGVPVQEAAGGRWLHVDSIPEDVPEHAVSRAVDRIAYLTGTQQNRSPGERSAVALERIAAAAERIADRLDSAAGPDG